MDNTEQIKQLLTQSNGKNIKAFLQFVYSIYEKRDDYTGDIRRCSLALEKQLSFLSFEEQDSLSGIVNALCAAYDFAAFTEGFQRGAQLILALLSSDK